MAKLEIQDGQVYIYKQRLVTKVYKFQVSHYNQINPDQNTATIR